MVSEAAAQMDSDTLSPEFILQLTEFMSEILKVKSQSTSLPRGVIWVLPVTGDLQKGSGQWPHGKAVGSIELVF